MHERLLYGVNRSSCVGHIRLNVLLNVLMAVLCVDHTLAFINSPSTSSASSPVPIGGRLEDRCLRELLAFPGDGNNVPSLDGGRSVQGTATLHAWAGDEHPLVPTQEEMQARGPSRARRAEDIAIRLIDRDSIMVKGTHTQELE